jgi:hypothetical protein
MGRRSEERPSRLRIQRRRSSGSGVAGPSFFSERIEEFLRVGGEMTDVKKWAVGDVSSAPMLMLRCCASCHGRSNIHERISRTKMFTISTQRQERGE